MGIIARRKLRLSYRQPGNSPNANGHNATRHSAMPIPATEIIRGGFFIVWAHHVPEPRLCRWRPVSGPLRRYPSFRLSVPDLSHSVDPMQASFKSPNGPYGVLVCIIRPAYYPYLKLGPCSEYVTSLVSFFSIFFFSAPLSPQASGEARWNGGWGMERVVAHIVRRKRGPHMGGSQIGETRKHQKK